MRTRSGLLRRTNRRSGAPDEKGEHTASVTATDSHPFSVPELNEWLDATDLDKGNWLQTSAGTRVQIMAVERTTVLDATVHNLTVAGGHTYYVVASSAAVLVHNCDLHDLARSESARSNTNQTAGAVARDSYTGEWAYGESGTTPVQVHPQLQQRLAALRSERGGSLDEWPAGQCADLMPVTICCCNSRASGSMRSSMRQLGAVAEITILRATIVDFCWAVEGLGRQGTNGWCIIIFQRWWDRHRFLA
ncbi:polymorphic toxin-type HINT domain-containing protein [Streptomyces sp. SCA2-2]|uniref:polymorphic toxin-type HINT domain-containing protein n=1 Tax=Streptomyces sp. SCA2-2 TaxID=1563677 RepID=UPI00101FEB05|nr:polymorphic toxin-type HINT domain-containing protein [Streptomyces sp. SCA2-2]RZE95662.1 hypothetical protein C0L86_19450 [Streptomyces sp. SCA2-2]